MSDKLPHQKKIPESYALGDRLRWDAPWVDVGLWVELPFWLMTNNSALSIEVSDHTFPVSTHDNYFELFFGEVTDSRSQVGYRGPLKKRDQLSEVVRQAMDAHPEADYVWRKCKTVVKIESRCNEDVWNAVMEQPSPRNREGRLYIAELCRAHVPVLNRLVQNYRLATYDYFAFEVAPWDVPAWNLDRGGTLVSTNIVGYRQWDYKPVIGDAGKKRTVYRLIDADDLRKQMPITPTPGELELLDALNLMERGDYSGAVRRVTTAIEVVVRHVVGKAIESAKGKREAEKFLSDTRMRFDKRVSMYQSLSGRTLSSGLEKDLQSTRKLRHRIVHGGYRIGPDERGMAQKAVDTGRWIFNWFENEATRRDIREKRIGLRSLGRDLESGMFRPRIAPDGVVLSSIREQVAGSP